LSTAIQSFLAGLTYAFCAQIRNLEESIKIDELTELLRDLFSQYGKVLDVVAKKNLKAKGQAFVVFDTVEAATQAIKEVQGFSLHSKPMVLQYARTKSDATVKQFGTPEEFELHKRRRMAEKGTSCSNIPLNQVELLTN